jgi:hypothetical protein
MIAAGQTRQIDLVLQAPPPPPVDQRSFYQKWWFWTAVGVAVAGGTVAAFAMANGKTEAPIVPGTLGSSKVGTGGP